MANVETDKLDFTLNGAQDGNVHLLKDYRIPAPDNSDHGSALTNEGGDLLWQHGDLAMLDGVYFPNAVQDYDGNWYGAVIIGNRVWMAENMRTTHFPDGTAIAEGDSSTSDSTPYHYRPTNSQVSVAENGLFYNWPAVMNGETSSELSPSGVQGIAPAGWHIPSKAEFEQLTGHVSAQMRYRADGSTASYIAKALAFSGGWSETATANTPSNSQTDNNRTLFGAKNAGGRGSSSSYHYIQMSLMWSAQQYDTTSAYAMRISHNQPAISIVSINKEHAFSVRCVSDMSPAQFLDWYIKTYGSMQHHLPGEPVVYHIGWDEHDEVVLTDCDGNTVTPQAIADSADAGKIVLLGDGGQCYTLGKYDMSGSPQEMVFVAVNFSAGHGNVAKLSFIYYNSDDGWDSASVDLQEKLDSGVNIKTVEGHSLIGAGNIELGKGIVTGAATSLTNTSANVTLNESGADLEHGIFLFIQFTVNMPALARLNAANTVINNSDILWNNTTLPAGAINSGDLCLFYYAYAGGTNMSFLLYNSRWACLKTINGGTLSGVGNISLAPPHTYHSTSMATADATTAITCAANERAFHAVSVTAAYTQLHITIANSWDNVIFLTGTYNLKLKIMIGENTVPVYFETNEFFDGLMDSLRCPTGIAPVLLQQGFQTFVAKLFLMDVLGLVDAVSINEFFDGTNVNLSKAGALKIVLEAVNGNVIADIDRMESYTPSN